MRFDVFQNFAAQMAGGFDEKAGGAQMGVMQGPMVSDDDDVDDDGYSLLPMNLLDYNLSDHEQSA